jgi:hypothetical protein
MNMKDWNRRFKASYAKKMHKAGRPLKPRRDSRFMRSDPTNTLIDRRLVRVKLLKKEENSSIRNKTIKNE